MLYVIVTYECTRAIMKIHQADIFSPSKNDPSVSLDLGLEHRIVIRESLSGNIEWADSLMFFIKFLRKASMRCYMPICISNPTHVIH